MRRTLFGCVIASMLLLAACGDEPAPPAPVADPQSRVETSLGTLLGRRLEGELHGWFGVPYAAPPIGPARWTAPVPPQPWGGVREALAHGPACVQIGTPLGGAPEEVYGQLWGAEDCLSLNIYAPTDAEGLPVMVWIHGGGNTVGHSGFYDGSRLAGEQDVIVVTVNYRLGPLGWFLHPALAGDGPADASGNYGTLDLIEALRWIHREIDAFGGDPERVTLFGESAGGTNIVSLLASPLARGLFHRAIIQSGSTGSMAPAQASHYRDDPEPGSRFSSAEIVLRMLGGPREDARRQAAELTAAETAARLRALDAPALFALYRDGEDLLGPDSPTVFRDGHVIPTEPALELLREGRWNRVPVMLGTNRDEPKIFMAFDPDLVMRLAGLPLWRRDAERYEQRARYSALAWKARGVDEPAAAIRASGMQAFTYRWDWDEEGKVLFVDLSALLGAAHGLEIPFVFGHFDVGPQTGLIYHDDNAGPRETLSAAMRGYWAEFARHGDPGRGGRADAPRWLASAEPPDGHSFLILDTPADGGIRMSDEHVRRDDVIRMIAADPALEGRRCEVARASFRFGSGAEQALQTLGCPAGQ